jgi:tRNA pseudouridine38-40 synthase
VQRKKFFYLIEVQYLGFRLHGWQQNPTVKTVQGMINKTLGFVLPDRRVKTIGGSRTDAKVSANQYFFELFLEEEPMPEDFFENFNRNLPQDIRALSIKEVDGKFNIIQHPKVKEYNYLFAFGEKPHPFSAALVASFLEDLDVEKMKEAAKVFEGAHSFHAFVEAANEKTKTDREILLAEIIDNEKYQANFFPEKTFIFRVKGKGFMRSQVRLMMGALVRVGNGELSIESLQKVLADKNEFLLPFKAPASGLILEAVEY